MEKQAEVQTQVWIKLFNSKLEEIFASIVEKLLDLRDFDPEQAMAVISARPRP
ncbi:MAG: hypothetical protein IPF97_12790 [Sphingomonadales bacterium]|nr:hypothetical protein [Sphingomonadales bacterium]MBK6720605.1 hypothetical protein [Sphingomonadales bacterium]MBK8861187.1 hypothetical protein [Sphingomonadales bacterium]MBK9587767.1 hypothetical protein [Sphingomonadales bacterium]MBL0001856.1 hypothetical protein [Sphingomonadales bacterium]